MSILLPNIDLTSSTIGSTGTCSFDDAGPSSSLKEYKSPAHIQIYNESGCGLQLTFQNSKLTTFVPAGGWQTITLPIGESGYSYQVIYLLTNPNVSTLITIYYAAGEPVPNIASIGNSPIGGGTLSSNANQLINTGNTPGFTLINVQPTDSTNPTWTADTSGNFTIKSDNAGVLTTLLQLIAGASPSVLLAASAVLTEILGSLKVDGQITLGTNGVIGGSNMLLGKTTAGDVFDAGTTSDTYVKSTNNVNIQINGTTQIQVSSSGLRVINGGLYGTDASNTILQSTGSSGTGNTRLQNTDHISVQVPGGTEQMGVTSTGCSFAHSINLVNGSLGQLKNFSGTGSGTVSTGITNPTAICFNPCTVSGSSQTIGGTTASSSVVTTGAGLAWSATAWHN